MNKEGFVNHIQELVSKNKSSEAINILKRLFEDIGNEELLNETIILSGRFRANEKSRHRNTIPTVSYNIEANRINETILNLTHSINDLREISGKNFTQYFKPVKTFPRSYFYQLLTIMFFGAIISYILIDREMYDLNKELDSVTKDLNTYKSKFDEINSKNDNPRLKPLVISMDSPNNENREENIYDPRTRKNGRTNSDDIEDALEHLDILFMKEITGQYWDRWEQIKRFNPNLILIHYSCFYPNSSEDESGRFDVFLNRIQDSDAQILVYSRQPQFKDDAYIRRWIGQKESQYPNLKDRLNIFKIYPEMDLKVQNNQFSSFRHMTTKGNLQGKIKDILKIN